MSQEVRRMRESWMTGLVAGMLTLVVVGSAKQ